MVWFPFLSRVSFAASEQNSTWARILAEWAAVLYFQLEEFFTRGERRLEGKKRHSRICSQRRRVCWSICARWAGPAEKRERPEVAPETPLFELLFLLRAGNLNNSHACLFVCLRNLNFLHVSDFVPRRARNLIHKTHNYKSDREVNEQCSALHRRTPKGRSVRR